MVVSIVILKQSKLMTVVLSKRKIKQTRVEKISQEAVTNSFIKKIKVLIELKLTHPIHILGFLQ